ncbi:unnamed protein product, partial [Caretta caretta]
RFLIGPFPALTRKHGVRCLLVPASPHVETYVQALAKVVGPTAIVAASKMYGKVVFFLASEDAAQEAVERERPGRMTGLVLREPELRLVLSAYADDVLLVVQDPGDLARVEACQAIYSAASSARVNWVKSSGLAVGDWRQSR